MKLISTLIFDSLSRCRTVEYINPQPQGSLVSRPVLYEKAMELNGHVCIIPSDAELGEELAKGLYVSAGELPEAYLTQGVELIRICEEIALPDLFNAVQAIFDFFDEWEDSVSAIIEEGGGYWELIQCTTDFFDTSVTLVDADFKYIAYSEKFLRDRSDVVYENQIPLNLANDLISNPEFERVIQEDDVFEFTIRGYLILGYNFKKDNKYLGRACLTYSDNYSVASYKFLLSVLAKRIKVMLHRYGSFLLKNPSVSRMRVMFEDILAGRLVDMQVSASILSTKGWSNDDEYVIIRLQPEFRHEWQLHPEYLIPQIEILWSCSCSVEYCDYLIVIFNKTIYSGNGRDDFRQELACFLRENLLMAGISRQFIGVQHIAAYYKQTEIAISIGKPINATNWYYCFDDYVVNYWMKYGASSFKPDQICSPALLMLRNYDQINNTQLYATLISLFKCNFNYTQAAKELFIHRTSLINRIERITGLTNIDLSDSDTRLYIELSYRYLDGY